MKSRYLVVLSCLLLAACDYSGTAEKTTTPKNKEVAEANSPEKKGSPESKETAKTELAESQPEGKETKVAEAPAPDPPVPVTADEKFADIESRFNTAMKAFSTMYRAAKADDRQAIYKEHYPKPESYAKEYMELAEEFPDDDVAIRSLLWVAQRARGTDEQGKATERLINDHIESDKLAGLCSMLRYSEPGETPVNHLKKLMEGSPHDAVKAAATISLADLYSSLDEARKSAESKKEKKDGDPEEPENKIDFAFMDDIDDDTINELYTRVVEEYPELKRGKRTYKEMAEGALFARKNLQIGLVAPDIEGEDLDGESFKLSEYRGKVVVIDFWGDW